MNYCPFCGAALLDGASFCHNCGKRIPLGQYGESLKKESTSEAVSCSVILPKKDVVVGDYFKISFVVNTNRVESFLWTPIPKTVVMGPTSMVDPYKKTYTYTIRYDVAGDYRIPGAKVKVDGEYIKTYDTSIRIIPKYVRAPKEDQSVGAQKNCEQAKKISTSILYVAFALLTVLATIAYCILHEMSLGPGLITAISCFVVLNMVLMLFFVDRMSTGLRLFNPILVAVVLALWSFVGYKYISPDNYDYGKANRKNTVESYAEYLSKHPAGKHRDQALAGQEECAYVAVKNSSRRLLNEYLSQYPTGRHRPGALKTVDEYVRKNYIEGNNDDKAFLDAYVQFATDGQYADFATNRLEEIKDEEDWNDALSADLTSAYREYISRHPNGKYVSVARLNISTSKPAEKRDPIAQVSKPQSKYRGNSLGTGNQPYADIYGSNFTGQGCFVKVNASFTSDVVVIVKKANKNGRVVGHAYIKKGSSYTITLPSEGTYQVFFYYGNDWNPELKMKDGRVGGFDSDEHYGYDNPHYFEATRTEYEGIEYTLQSTVNGNFSMKQCQEDDVF